MANYIGSSDKYSAFALLQLIVDDSPDRNEGRRPSMGVPTASPPSHGVYRRRPRRRTKGVARQWTVSFVFLDGHRPSLRSVCRRPPSRQRVYRRRPRRRTKGGARLYLTVTKGVARLPLTVMKGGARQRTVSFVFLDGHRPSLRSVCWRPPSRISWRIPDSR